MSAHTLEGKMPLQKQGMGDYPNILTWMCKAQSYGSKSWKAQILCISGAVVSCLWGCQPCPELWPTPGNVTMLWFFFFFLLYDTRPHNTTLNQCPGGLACMAWTGVSLGTSLTSYMTSLLHYDPRTPLWHHLLHYDLRTPLWHRYSTLYYI